MVGMFPYSHWRLSRLRRRFFVDGMAAAVAHNYALWSYRRAMIWFWNEQEDYEEYYWESWLPDNSGDGYVWVSIPLDGDE